MSKKPYFILALTFSLVPYSKLQAAGVCPETLCSRCECIGDGVVRQTDKMYDGEIIHTYDIYGREISTQNNLDAGNYGSYFTYTYDSDGNRTSRTSYQNYDFEHPESNTPTESYIWTYDANGNKTSETRYYDRNGHGYGDVHVVDQDYYTYDENNRLISQTNYEYLSGGQEAQYGTHYVYTYNENGYTEAEYEIFEDVWGKGKDYKGRDIDMIVGHTLRDTPLLKDNKVVTYACGSPTLSSHYDDPYCDKIITYFDDNLVPTKQEIFKALKTDGVWDHHLEETRNCAECNCCTSVEIPSSATLIAYNDSIEPVCATGYGFDCSIGDGSLIQNNSSGNSRPVRKIYTVEEAEKVSKKTGNTFKLRYK